MVTTLRPTRRPPPAKPVKREPPTEAWLEEEATKLKDFWQPQKDRMKEDQELYELVREEPEEGESEVVFNDPRVQINKVARMLASAEWRAVFDPDIDPMPNYWGQVSERDDSATLKEKFVSWAWTEGDKAWREGLNAGLKTTLLKQALVRGMMAIRVKPAATSEDAEEEEFPFELTPIDAINLFPRLRGASVGHYVHQYETQWGDVAEEWGLEDDNKDPNDAVKVLAYYDEWYWALMIDGTFVKEPEEHGLGFCPIVVAVAEGGEFRGDDQTQESDWVRFVGTGLLEDVRQAVKDRNRAATQRDEMISRTINPAYVTWTKDGKPILVDLRNGAANPMNIDDKEDVRLLNPGAASVDLAKHEQDLDSRIQRGTVPWLLFGEGDSPLSGYAISLTSKNARDILEPWIECYSGLVERVNVRLLRMVANPELGIASDLTVAGSSGKLGRFRERIAASQLGQDFSHTIEFGDVLPSDLPAILGMALQAIQAKLLSRRTILEKLLNSVTSDSKGELVNIMREEAALSAGQQMAQLGIKALQVMLGEGGMTDAFGEATEAPQPQLSEGPTGGLSPEVLPQAEMGIPPQQIAPGSPEEMAIQQQQAAGIPPQPF